MSTTIHVPNGPSQSSAEDSTSVDALADGLEKTAIQSDAEDTQAVAAVDNLDSRPRIVYTRKQLVRLSQSPLVKVPDGMPAFKAWFGEWNEQSLLSTKKESDTLNANGATRERRYRREAEDGDGTARPPFRSALSQPSQMGNFKHQPLRAADRDRETERDLRSLSDRYDRDKATRGERMGLASHSGLLRNRDRDAAPHLASDRDTSRPMVRKRNGESKEDWRRGAEPPRAGRDENNTRRDREEREGQRSRARDGSRTRDSPPATRRERERDRERFNEVDEDLKRWREDGKREDKQTSRRDKERLGREKDGVAVASRDPADEREGWSIAEDKKRLARERRNDDREERREREKEKEPAWMETYVPPSTSSAGILGGKSGEDEIDSIQAWKKDMKERELKAKGITSEISGLSTAQNELSKVKQSHGASAAPEGQLDEIQLFKLMMKQEEQKRAASSDGKSAPEARSSLSDTCLQLAESSLPGLARIQEGQTTAPEVVNRNGSSGAVSSQNGQAGSVDPLLGLKSSASLNASASASIVAASPSTLPGLGIPPSFTNTSHPGTGVRSESNGSRLFALKTSDSVSDSSSKDSTSNPSAFDPPRQSRLLAFGAQSAKVTAQPSPQSAVAAAQLGRLQQVDPLWPNQRRPSASPALPLSASLQSVHDKVHLQQQILSNGQLGQLDTIMTNNLPHRSGLESAGHNPLMYENVPRSGHPMDSHKEFNTDVGRSAVPLSASERTGLVSQSDSMHLLSDVRRNPTPPTANYGVTSPISPFENQLNGGQTSYSSGKGSRMAKHFERQRDQAANVPRNLSNAALAANGMLPNRQETFNNPLGTGENRNIQDLLTMLNNSAQAQRAQLAQGLGHQQGPQSLHMGPSGNGLVRHDPLMDNDEGRFAPDGLVPGLRPAQPPVPRNRDINNGSLYANQLDESLNFNARLGPQQRAGMDQVFAGQVPSQFNGQGLNGARGNLAFQQQAMRGGPSPINNFNPIQGPPQRLPPGLANLGGRPPHEPSQFLGGGPSNFGGVPSQLHAGLQHANNQQSFNQFQNPNLGMVGNQGHLRGQAGLGQLGNSLGGGMNGMDFRNGPGVSQNQLLGLGGPGPNIVQAMRGGQGFNAQQLQGPPPINVRQQHNLQPQMLQQLLPQQLQGIPPGQHNPNDLMALLMSGPHRE